MAQGSRPNEAGIVPARVAPLVRPWRRSAYDFVARVRIRTAGNPGLRRTIQRTLKGLGAGIPYAVAVEPRLIETTHLEVEVPGLAPELDGYRIIHLSDIHMNIVSGRAFLRRIVEKANALDGDLIALTGDFITHSPRWFEPCLEELAHLRAADGALAVRGNHDYTVSLEDMRAGFESIGVKLLENEHVVIEPARHRVRCVLGEKCPDPRLTIAGVGDVWEGIANPGLALMDAPEEPPRILLSHNPQLAEVLPAHLRVTLQLSGHTHGGQIRPFNKPLRLLSDGTQKYVAGLVRAPSTVVYISRGVGTSALYFRWNCRPEIALVVLRSAPHPCDADRPLDASPLDGDG